jgi:uncharacterized paraquat-inducible protein A
MGDGVRGGQRIQCVCSAWCVRGMYKIALIVSHYTTHTLHIPQRMAEYPTTKQQGLSKVRVRVLIDVYYHEHNLHTFHIHSYTHYTHYTHSLTLFCACAVLDQAGRVVPQLHGVYQQVHQPRLELRPEDPRRGASRLISLSGHTHTHTHTYSYSRSQGIIHREAC